MGITPQNELRRPQASDGRQRPLYATALVVGLAVGVCLIVSGADSRGRAEAPAAVPLAANLAMLLGSVLVVIAAVALMIEVPRYALASARRRIRLAQPRVSPPPAEGTHLIAGLERLSAMKSDGIITDREFKRAKRKLLHRRD